MVPLQHYTPDSALLIARFPVAVIALQIGTLVPGVAVAVVRTNRATGDLAPQLTGDPRFDRAARAHLDRPEWLPAMRIFASTRNPLRAALPRLIRIAARVVRFASHVSGPELRYPGVIVPPPTTFALIAGGLGRRVTPRPAGA